MRLIDADELIKRFKELKGADSLANMFVTDVINEIKKQPTAYDVDKVVERLKKELILEKMYAECWREEDLEETYDEIREMSAVCLKKRAKEIGLDPDTVGY